MRLTISILAASWCTYAGATASLTAGRFPPVEVGKSGSRRSVALDSPIVTCSAGVIGCTPTVGVTKVLATVTPENNTRYTRGPKCGASGAVGCLRYPMGTAAPYGLDRVPTPINFYSYVAKTIFPTVNGVPDVVDDTSGPFQGPGMQDESYLFDLDSDGDLDVLLSSTPGANSVVINNSPGSLSGHTVFAASASLFAADANGNTPDYADAVADVDGDGDLDIITKFGMWKNDGTGTFTAFTLSAEKHAKCTDRTTKTGGCVVGDVNGDGWIDVLSDKLYLNNGDGTGSFTVQTSNPVKCTHGEYVCPPGGCFLNDVYFDSCILLDIDGDGDLDLIDATEGFFNDGTGTFTADASLPGCGSVCSAADLNGDGKVDLIAESKSYLSNGAGFDEIEDSVGCRGAGAPGAYASSITYGCAPADLDGDGDIDLLVYTGWSGPALYVNDGTGIMAADLTTAISDVPATSAVCLGDIDGDGDVDIMLGAQSAGYVLFNEGGGGYLQVAQTHGGALPWGSATSLSAAVEAGDIDGDGDIDIVSFPEQRNNIEFGQTTETPGRKAGDTLVAFNDGTGNFTAVLYADFNHTHFAPRGKLADIDGDGDLDMVELDWWDGKAAPGGNDPSNVDYAKFKFYLNDGTGTFTHSAAHDLDLDKTKVGWYGGPRHMLYFYDRDGDGDLDMTFADTAGQFAGGGGGAETVGITNNWPNAFTASYDTDVAGFQRQPYDKDGDGVLDSELVSYADAVGDLNGDGVVDKVALLSGVGITDAVVATKGPDFTHGLLASNTIGGDVLLTKGAGQNWAQPKGDTVMFIYILDIDGDGDNDVYVQLLSNDIFYAAQPALFMNRGKGLLTMMPATDPFVAYAGEASHTTFADLDGDGDLDVVRTANDGRMAMFFWTKCSGGISIPGGACATPPQSSKRLVGSDFAMECDPHWEKASLITECAMCPLGSERAAGEPMCTDCPKGWAVFLPDGSGGQGEACQQCPAGSYSEEAGTRSCTRCTLGYYNAVNGSTSCTKARAGYFATEGAVKESPCTAGRYGSTTGNGDGQCTGACDEGYVCPPGSTSPTFTSIAPACKAGYYLYNGTCLTQPLGTNCPAGTTLATLPLQKGYYRLSADTNEVRLCPDGLKTTTACQGGVGNPCAKGIAPYSVYCQLCTAGVDLGNGTTMPLSSYKKATDTDAATCVPCSGGSVSSTILLALGGIAALGVAYLLSVYIKGKMPPAFKERAGGIVTGLSLKNKVKILLGFYQIATKVGTLYEVSLPQDVTDFLDNFSGAISFGMTGIASTPLACMDLGGYQPRLWFWVITPAVLLLVVVGGVLINHFVIKKLKKKKAAVVTSTTGKKSDDDGTHAHRFEMDDDDKREETLFEQMLPAVLFILFILYPMVTTAAFDGFPCYGFDETSFLRSDVSIECNTPEHNRITTLSWIAIIVYPLGIWVFCALLLFKASSAILAGKETPLTRSIGFLHKEYDSTAFFWELMEMARKFLLVGLFVNFQPGTILQITVATIVCATYLMVQLQAAPYKNRSDDFVAAASSFALLMVFVCSMLYKFDMLTQTDRIQAAMTDEQESDYIVSGLLLSIILVASVVGSLLFAFVLVIAQIIVEIKNNAKLRRIKYAKDGKWVECKTLRDPQAFHLFLSHAWPAAQDRMRIVKARFLEALPSCRTFLDVDDLKSGSGTAEVDKSECILVFCTNEYFKKKNSLKELYRAVCQRRPILAMLEPDATQEGGFNQKDIEAMITNKQLDKFKLRAKWTEWKEDGELLPAAFDHAPDEVEVRAALFATPPVEWNRLPHFQDVTIRLVAQNGIFNGAAGDMYLQGEAAMGKVSLPPPVKGREFHLFCSPFNAGAAEFAEELAGAPVWVTKGKKASAQLTYTSDVSKVAQCDHMLVLLDQRTYTSGDDTAQLMEHIHEAMRAGVHLNCIHEFPAVVGKARNECDFGLFFGDDWTPAHLTGGKTNLYKEIAFALKGAEWRQPGLVAVASKIAGSAGEHKPINVIVPDTYEPKKGPNKWKTGEGNAADALIKSFDTDKDHVVSVEELYQLLSKTSGTLSHEECGKVFDELLSKYDTNKDGQVSIQEVAVYITEKNLVPKTDPEGGDLAA